MQAFVSSGKYYFDQGDLKKAVENYRQALALRPHQPNLWFRVGTLAMQLEDWELALTAFSEVVQQEPEEAQGWANVGAVHMHNKQPGEAYAALNEVRFERFRMLCGLWNVFFVVVRHELSLTLHPFQIPSR